MAELHVQRKEGNMWPWIIAALVVLALLLWFFWGGEDDLDLATADVTPNAVVATVPNTEVMGSASGTIAGTAVTEFLQFAEGTAAGTMGLDHNSTSNGLRQLAAALNEIASGESAGGVALQPRIDEIRDRANTMQQNANSTDHALQTREAFAVASSLMMQMNSNMGGADGALTGLQNAAMAIKPSEMLLDQTDAVKQFFSQAAQEVRGMTNTPM